MATFPPVVPEETYQRMQVLADRARAQHTMSVAADRVLGFAAAHADHRAELWRPDRTAPYTLEPFLTGLPIRILLEAEHALYTADSDLPPGALDLQAVIVVPDWVNTARGALDALEEPDWVRVWEPITDANRNPDRFPAVGYAVALVANRRRPSLLRVDWEWCAVLPFATPAYTEGEAAA